MNNDLLKLTGTISYYKPEKGFGFLRSLDGKEFFFHRSAFQSDEQIVIGRYVIFEAEKTAAEPGKRPSAVKVIYDAERENQLFHLNFQSNSKVQCKSCGRYMVPRVVFQYGRPVGSICPFCTATFYTPAPEPAPDVGPFIKLICFLFVFSVAAVLFMAMSSR